MARFFHDEDYYYDRGMRENPPAIRALYLVIIGILFAFSKVYWRWRHRLRHHLEPYFHGRGRGDGLPHRAHGTPGTAHHEV